MASQTSFAMGLTNTTFSVALNKTVANWKNTTITKVQFDVKAFPYDSDNFKVPTTRIEEHFRCKS